LRTPQGYKEIRSIDIKLDGGEADVNIYFKEGKRKRFSDELREEIVRAIWQNRLYSLRRIKMQVEYTVRFELALRGREAARLQHEYGPRPYGWLSAEESAALTP
jgi:hypothetical protein